ncbi:MAG: hypothetical protein AB1485_08090 [Candidatus Thermoplasmatota archaeon]
MRENNKENGKATKCTRAFSVVIVAAMVLAGFLGVISVTDWVTQKAKAETTTLYSESTSGWTLSGLWHQTSYRKYSGSYSLAYNQESTHTYDTGSTNSGDATSPSVTLGSSPSLTFQSWYQTEDTRTTYDKKLVYISKDGGTTWTQIYQVSYGHCLSYTNIYSRL